MKLLSHPGVSFFDTRQWATEVGRSHGCIIHFEMHLPIKNTQGIAWLVRCVARWYDERGMCKKERGEGGAWPCSEAATFTGLELNLLNRLDRKLTEEKVDAEQVSAVRLPGF